MWLDSFFKQLCPYRFQTSSNIPWKTSQSLLNFGFVFGVGYRRLDKRQIFDVQRQLNLLCLIVLLLFTLCTNQMIHYKNFMVSDFSCPVEYSLTCLWNLFQNFFFQVFPITFRIEVVRTQLIFLSKYFWIAHRVQLLSDFCTVNDWM